MKRRKSANKWKKERDKITPKTKNQYEKPIKKTPNQHTQSIIQKEEEKKYDKNNEKVSTPKIKLIHSFLKSVAFQLLVLEKNFKIE